MQTNSSNPSPSGHRRQAAVPASTGFVCESDPSVVYADFGCSAKADHFTEKKQNRFKDKRKAALSQFGKLTGRRAAVDEVAAVLRNEHRVAMALKHKKQQAVKDKGMQRNNYVSASEYVVEKNPGPSCFEKALRAFRRSHPRPPRPVVAQPGYMVFVDNTNRTGTVESNPGPIISVKSWLDAAFRFAWTLDGPACMHANRALEEHDLVLAEGKVYCKQCGQCVGDPSADAASGLPLLDMIYVHPAAKANPKVTQPVAAAAAPAASPSGPPTKEDRRQNKEVKVKTRNGATFKFTRPENTAISTTTYPEPSAPPLPSAPSPAPKPVKAEKKQTPTAASGLPPVQQPAAAALAASASAAHPPAPAPAVVPVVVPAQPQPQQAVAPAAAAVPPPPQPVPQPGRSAASVAALALVAIFTFLWRCIVFSYPILGQAFAQIVERYMHPLAPIRAPAGSDFTEEDNDRDGRTAPDYRSKPLDGVRLSHAQAVRCISKAVGIVVAPSAVTTSETVVPYSYEDRCVTTAGVREVRRPYVLCKVSFVVSPAIVVTVVAFYLLLAAYFTFLASMLVSMSSKECAGPRLDSGLAPPCRPGFSHTVTVTSPGWLVFFALECIYCLYKAVAFIRCKPSHVMYYSPHLLSCVAMEYSNGTGADALRSSVRQKILRTACLPFSAQHIPLICAGTEAGALEYIPDQPFFTGGVESQMPL